MSESDRERKMAELLQQLITVNEYCTWRDDLDTAVQLICVEAKKLIQPPVKEPTK